MVTVGADSTVQESVGVPISITMYGQTVNYGVNGIVTLPDMTTVSVTWGGGGPTGVTIQIQATLSSLIFKTLLLG